MSDNYYNIQDTRQFVDRPAAEDIPVDTAFREKVCRSFDRLLHWCEQEEYKGYDPYDGLNSRVFRAVPLLRDNRLARLFWIQFFKRSPVNLRHLAGVKKDYNPKALGLFLSGYCHLYRKENKNSHLEKIRHFSGKLMELKSAGWSGSCWGYNFDWQARAFFQPRYTPTVVATTFIGSALLDAYELTGETVYLENARSACNFILKDLNRTYDSGGCFAFSYSPLDKSVVYNASLLGSRLLARVYSHTREYELIDPARESVRFCCHNQNGDGSWNYGKQHFHKWIDNFHTGYNLECLADYARYSGDLSYQAHFDRGFEFYINNFFTEEGIPKYYHNSTYPIDIHSAAQLVITLFKTGRAGENIELLNRVLGWTIGNMQSDKGYFFFQLNGFLSSRIPYMRWAQAWMFYAMSTYIDHTSEMEEGKGYK
jgi:rhamnogalacturonyl hydrolase YesR